MKSEVKPRLMSVRAAAEELGLSVWTLRSWCYTGKISSYKLGARLMVAPAEIDRIIRESERRRLESRQ